MKRVFLIAVTAIIVVIAFGYIYISSSWRTDFSDAFPVKEIEINPTQEMIEHGKYLVYGPAHCADCHTPMEQRSRLANGEKLPLIGGFGLEIPFGTIYAPNITPDKETGIGNFTNGELYRMMRHNIRRDGRATIEFMPFANMSEYDVYSIIAFLKSQPAVKNSVPETRYNFLGKVFSKFVFKPTLPNGVPLEFVEKDTTAAYGKYLAESVANCKGCHTARDLKTNKFIGPDYAGGMHFEPSNHTEGWQFFTPNLTPDEATGAMFLWTEEQFIQRFKTGRGFPTSPMPWEAYKSFDDNDLKALYKFFSSLEGIANKEAGKVIPPKES